MHEISCFTRACRQDPATPPRSSHGAARQSAKVWGEGAARLAWRDKLHRASCSFSALPIPAPPGARRGRELVKKTSTSLFPGSRQTAFLQRKTQGSPGRGDKGGLPGGLGNDAGLVGKRRSVVRPPGGGLMELEPFSGHVTAMTFAIKVQRTATFAKDN